MSPLACRPFRGRFLTLLFFCFASFFFIPPLSAAAPAISGIKLTDTQDLYFIGESLEVMEDTGSKAAIPEIRRGAFDSAFTPSGGKFINMGFRDDPVWMKTRLINTTHDHQEMFLESMTLAADLAEVWAFAADGTFQYNRDGIQVPPGERPYRGHAQLNRINIGPGETVDIYIKIQGSVPVIHMGKLWKKDAYLSHEKREFVYFGAIGGIFLGVMLYNAFLFVSLKEKTYLYYVLAILVTSILTYALNGVLNAWLWPGYRGWQIRADLMVGYAAIFTSLLYTRIFLDTRIHAPKTDKLIIVSIAVTAFAFFGQGFLSVTAANKLQLLLLIPYYALPLCAAAICMRANRPEARFFLFAWVFVFLAMFIYDLIIFGLLPTTEYWDHLPETGYALFAVFLSFALADRINTLRKEKSLAEEDFKRQKESIMQELHDGLGHWLARINLSSQSALEHIGAGQPATRPVDDIYHDSRAASLFMRAGLAVLDNSAGGRLGDVIALMRANIEKAAAGCNMRAQFEFDHALYNLKLHPTALLHLVRCLQEGMTNVLKHSMAGSTFLKARYSSGTIEFLLEDDGRGFDVERADAGHGLKNMQKRMAAANGSIKVDSAPGKGTRLHLYFPYGENK